MTAHAPIASAPPASATDPRRESVLEVRDLHKTYRIGFLRKRVEAVCGIDFTVQRGEIFGLLGPNGAGKTSTLKMLLRLTFPSRGSIAIFGVSNADRRAMQRLGYMPENPYVYQYLKPLEFLDLCGRLVGMDGPTRRKASLALVERVGLGHAVDRPIGKFSKGMTQRIGLAQALLHDPELLILDEPMSGLDPIGRKQIRDVLIEQRRAGKTLIFTSHILSDVERLCDRVAIMHRGRITSHGRIDELLRPEVRRVELSLRRVDDGLRAELLALGPGGSVRALQKETTRHVDADLTSLVVEGDELSAQVLRAAIDRGAQVVEVTPQRETLEDLFVRGAMSSGAHDP